MSVSEDDKVAAAVPAEPTKPTSPAAARGAALSKWLHGRLPSYGPPVYRKHSYLQVLGFAGLMVIVGFVWSGSDYRIGVMTAGFIYGIAAIGLYFAYSLGGLFAFSQGAFMGLGAYVSAKVTKEHSFIMGMIVAIVITFVVALVVGLILRNARHLYFAIGALAVASLLTIMFTNWTYIGGPNSGVVSGLIPPGLFGHDFFEVQDVFWFTLAVICIVLFVGILIERSPMRRNALAGKEIPTVARASGIPVNQVTIMLFGFGCSLAGIAGCLQAHSISAITPDSFGVGLAIDLYLMILLGGLRSIWGPVVGALFFVWLPEWLRFAQSYETVIYAMLLLLTIIVLPEGIVGTLGKLGRKAVSLVKSH